MLSTDISESMASKRKRSNGRRRCHDPENAIVPGVRPDKFEYTHVVCDNFTSPFPSSQVIKVEALDKEKRVLPGTTCHYHLPPKQLDISSLCPPVGPGFVLSVNSKRLMDRQEFLAQVSGKHHLANKKIQQSDRAFHCSDKNNTKYGTLCTCLKRFLGMVKQEEETENIPQGTCWRMDSQRCETFNFILERLVVLRMILHGIIDAHHNASATMKAIDNSFTEDLEDRMLAVIGYFCTFHFGKALSKEDEDNSGIAPQDYKDKCENYKTSTAKRKGKNDNNIQVTFSIGVHQGKDQLRPHRFCCTSFFSILEIPETFRKGILKALDSNWAYNWFMTNATMRCLFLTYFVNNGLAINEIPNVGGTPMAQYKGNNLRYFQSAVKDTRIQVDHLCSNHVSAVYNFYERPDVFILCHKASQYLSGLPTRGSDSPLQSFSNFPVRKGDISCHVDGDQIQFQCNVWVSDLRQRHEIFFYKVSLLKMTRGVGSYRLRSDNHMFQYSMGKGENIKSLFGSILGLERGFTIPALDESSFGLQVELNDFEQKLLSLVREAVVKDNVCNISSNQDYDDTFLPEVTARLVWTEYSFRHRTPREEITDRYRFRREKNKDKPVFPSEDTRFIEAHKSISECKDYRTTGVRRHLGNVIMRRSAKAANPDVHLFGFLPLAKEGMTLVVKGGEGSKGNLVEIPYGHLVLTPAQICYADTFCTSFDGNLRFVLDVTLKNKFNGKRLGRSKRLGKDDGPPSNPTTLPNGQNTTAEEPPNTIITTFERLFSM